MEQTTLNLTDEYTKAWLNAEQEAMILGFNVENPWAWALSERLKSTSGTLEKTILEPSEVPSLSKPHDGFTRTDFEKALKRVSRRVKR